MAYETTEVPVQRSQGDIASLILTNGGTGYNMVFRPPVVGFEAELPIEGKLYHIRIAASIAQPPDYLERRVNQSTVKKIPMTADDRAKWLEQRQRRIWRVFYYHLKDVFECAASGVMDLRELLMPHMVDGQGRTLAEVMIPQLERLGAMRALPAPAAEVTDGR